MAIGTSNKSKKSVNRKLFDTENVKTLTDSPVSCLDTSSRSPPVSQTSREDISGTVGQVDIQTPKRSVPLSERQQLALLRQLTSSSESGNGASGKNDSCNECSVERRNSSSHSEFPRRNERGETPLHIATIKGNLHGVRKLLRRGIDVNVPDFAGWAPLHEACNHGWLDIARLLIKFGADVNAQGFGKDTPLHDAAVNGHYEIVQLLLKNGADYTSKNVQWNTPLDVARSEKVISILRQAQEVTDQSDKVSAKVSYLGGTAENSDLWQSERLPCQSTTDLCQLTMRKHSPQNQTHKGADKPTSPRLTLRFQSIKSPRDDKTSTVAKVYDLCASDRKYQSYCVTMEAKGDVYDFQKDECIISPNSVSVPESDMCPPKLTTQGSKEGSSPLKDLKSTVDSSEHSDIVSVTEKPESMEVTSAKVNGGCVSGDSVVKERDTSDVEKEDTRRKRRKSSDSNQSRHSGQSHTSGRSHKSPSSKSLHQETHGEQKSSPKGKKRGSLSSSDTESNQSDAEMPDIVVPDSVSSNHNGGTFAAGLHSPKVPPLKIVIPSGSNSLEVETRERSKVSSSSKNALPYVVNPSSVESVEATETAQNSNGEVTKESNGKNVTPTSSSSSSNAGGTCTPEKSKEDGNHHEERFQRVTRSSQRMQAAMSTVTVPQAVEIPTTSSSSTPTVPPTPPKGEQSGESSTEEQVMMQTDIHPRKRKLRTRDTPSDGSLSNLPPSTPVSSSSSCGEDSQQNQQQTQQQQQLLNSYQMYLNIRKQVEKRRKSMFVVHPKPPQGFKDYLLNRCSYVLEGNAASRLSVPMIPPPQSLEGSIKELFIQQEKERYRLRLQHLIEREKLVLSAEQEILRVHGRAARAMANQTVPLSVCSILKDEEIYNVLNVDQDDKDKNVRSRYNGRLFLSWLQDVDDKWEKIKEAMLLRHHNEAESLHAVQKLDWEWKMKELAMCDIKSTPIIDDISVPMVHVSDDFDLLPA